MAPMRWLPSRKQSHQLIVSAYVGSVIAVFTIIACLSFGTLIFSANLSFGVAQGIGMALTSAVLAGGIVAWRSSYPATIAIPQDRTAPILALMAVNIAAHLPASASAEEKCLTILAAIALTSILTGVLLYALGRFELGNLIRFIPYPVVGGFLAGSGWLLILGSIRVMTGESVSLAHLGRIFEHNLAAKALPGVLFGLVLFLVLRRYRRPVLVPALLVGAVLVFYVIVLAAGTSIAETRASGWLPIVPRGEGFRPLLWDLSLLREVRWDSLAGAAGLA